MRKLVQVIFLLTALTAKYASGQIMVNAGSDTAVCIGNAVQLGITVSGGTAPYTYQWSPGTSLSSTLVANPVASPQGNTTYSVTVTDNLGASGIDNVSIQVNALPLVNAGNDTVACKGDYFYGLNATADTTGVGPLTYIWTSTNGMPMFGIGSNFTLYPQNSAMYYVEVSTYTGCKGKDSVYVTVDALDVEVAYTMDGVLPDTLVAQVNNAVGAVTYNWSNAETTPFTIAMGSGHYSVEVYDSYGCYDSDIDTVYPTSMAITSNITNSVCNGNSGAVDITVTGGTPPYQYYWSNNEATEDISGLNPSTYMVTVTDNHGFFVEGSYEVHVFDVNIEFVSDGIAPDTLIGHVTGGTPPYIYDWYGLSFGTDSTLDAQVPGAYLIVSDASSCVSFASWTALSVSQHFTGATCDSQANGAIDLSVTGLFPPFSYQWSNGATTQDVSGLTPGGYFATITDARGVTSSAGGYVEAANVIWGSIRNHSDGIFPDTLYPHLFTQLSPVSFLWDNGSVSLARPIYGRGVYSLEINAGPLGCSRYVENYIGAHALTDYLALNDTIGFYNVLNNDSLGWDSFYHNQQISSFIYTQPLHGTITGDYYSGQVYIVSPGYTGPDSFTYVVCVTDTSEFSFPHYCDSATVYINLACQECVWPGDANNDGLVDNNDLLPIGLAYSASGPTRANASIVWQGQPAMDWADTLADGTNFKYIDCDGNGLINADDTMPVLWNFSQIHPRSGGDEWRGGVPTLSLHFNADTSYNGDTLIISIVLGDSNTPANDVYGLAFTINYDALVADSANITAVFGDSWLGNSTDKISLSKNFGQVGQLKCALTRIDHTNRSGFGEIGYIVTPITTDNINGKDYYSFIASVSDITVIDNSGNMLSINSGSDSALIEYEPNYISELAHAPQLAIYPNPARQQLIVDSKGQGVMTITDATGKAIMVVNKVAVAKETLNVEALAPGVYYLTFSTNTGATTKKFAIIR